MEEEDSVEVVCVEVQQGDLDREVTLTFSTANNLTADDPAMSGGKNPHLFHNYHYITVYLSHKTKLYLYFCTSTVDYTAVSVDLVFGATTSRICTNIDIFLDRVVESPESYDLRLSSLDQEVVIVRSMVEAFIIDSTRKTQ